MSVERAIIKNHQVWSKTIANIEIGEKMNSENKYETYHPARYFTVLKSDI